MYERLLNETEKYLEKGRDKDHSILALWDAMVEASEEIKFEMPETIGDFECLIEADKRFIFSTGTMDEEPDDDIDIGEEEGEYEVGEDFFEVEEMEKIGFNQNQIVKLRKHIKKSSPDDDDVPTFAPHLERGKKNEKKSAVASVKKQIKKPVLKKKTTVKRKK